jgi:23S rRNA (uridine2552-2'-O)-methyltransferase
MADKDKGKGAGSRSTTSQRFGGARQLTVRLRTARGRSSSSQRWLERQLNDPYVAAAKREGWRSRAAFKLIEIDDKYRILRAGQRVVDLGAAPGGWSQVAAQRVKAAEGRGQVIAIDYLPVDPIAGVTILELDFLDDDAPDKLKALLRDGGADVVLSDMAAPTTGHASTDHLRIMALAEAAAQFATEVLAPGGVFLAKVFQGGTERSLLDRLKRDFAIVRHVKPKASRAGSAELYVLATGFRGRR